MPRSHRTQSARQEKSVHHFICFHTAIANQISLHNNHVAATAFGHLKFIPNRKAGRNSSTARRRPQGKNWGLASLCLHDGRAFAVCSVRSHVQHTNSKPWFTALPQPNLTYVLHSIDLIRVTNEHLQHPIPLPQPKSSSFNSVQKERFSPHKWAQRVAHWLLSDASKVLTDSFKTPQNWSPSPVRRLKTAHRLLHGALETPPHRLCPNEASLKVGVDDAGCLGGRHARLDGPCPAFLAGRERTKRVTFRALMMHAGWWNPVPELIAHDWLSWQACREVGRQEGHNSIRLNCWPPRIEVRT